MSEEYANNVAMIIIAIQALFLTSELVVWSDFDWAWGGEEARDLLSWFADGDGGIAGVS